MKIINKPAYFNYNVLETLEAGIVLSGGEVKSIKEGRVNLSESFARIENGELILKNAYIHPYHGMDPRYNPRADRKLLVHKSQINSLIGKISKPGVTLVPLSLYTTRNLIKVELGLVSPKRKVDKRKAIKEKDEKRRLEQELKELR